MKKVLLSLLSVIVLLVLFVVCAYAMKWTKIAILMELKTKLLAKKNKTKMKKK